MCDTTNASTQSIADYLAQLLKDRKQLAAFPNVFIHVERLLDEGELTRLNFRPDASPRALARPIFAFLAEIWPISRTCDRP